jgi:hypothetical protein
MWSSTLLDIVRTCRTRTEQRYCSVRVRFEQNRTRISMFENLPNTNRTRTLFGSVRCGAELEQTEQDLENVRFGLFARLAISGPKVFLFTFFLANSKMAMRTMPFPTVLVGIKERDSCMIGRIVKICQPSWVLLSSPYR